MNKYGAKPTHYRGVRYDSAFEAGRAQTLDILREVGEIRWWHPKPGTFRLGVPENCYRPDFLVVETTGDVHIEDVKGQETAKFKRDRKLWAKYGPCDLYIITKKGVEIITPERGDNAS